MDVVVPFRGSPAELEAVRDSVRRLELREGDSVVVVDNTPGRLSAEGPVPVLAAADRRTPGYARNRGAARGRAEWLVFFDADVYPAADLLERYFDPPPRERTGILAGAVVDEAVPPRGNVVARYMHIRGSMHQDETFRYGQWGFPQSANVACRRAAFEEVGGFREDIRAAEDADLTYRLRAAGWEVERRDDASAVHRGRRTLRGFIAQKALHGAGGAWLDREYPGSFPARRRPGLVWWGVRRAASGLGTAMRARDRDEALFAILDPMTTLAFEFGRSLPNERPLLRRR